VCGYCQSTVVRDGETLKRIGKMAELFDDHSPLQLQTSGSWNGQAFTLVGRLQYKYGEGTWTEWHAVLADGSSAYLSEDNGAYVFTTAQAVQQAVPEAARFRVGATTAINGKSYTVASNQAVQLIAAQGELPRLPELGASHAMVELRSQNGAALLSGATTAQGRAAEEVLSIDYSTQPPSASKGVAVLLEDLKLTGLRDASTKDEKGRQFACPNCGASLTVQLASSKSMTCGSCNSIIDLSQGIGGELKHAIQDEPVQPLIPLGSTGLLQGVQWQVVGFQHRMGFEPSDPDEHFGWEEYLLYNAKRGFTFLVDSTEGWSLVKPATGAPVVSSNGQSASYLGTAYLLKESYNAETHYVLGEFYWQVSRGQKTSNRDYAAGKSLLSMEQSAQELTWSVGSKIDSDVVVKAFKLEGKKDLLQRSDVGPFTAAKNPFARPEFIIFVVFVVVILLISQCSSCDPKVENCSSSGSGYRTSGGSYGGYSGGGGHK
jgi:ribosomal protein S27E